MLIFFPWGNKDFLKILWTFTWWEKVCVIEWNGDRESYQQQSICDILINKLVYDDVHPNIKKKKITPKNKNHCSRAYQCLEFFLISQLTPHKNQHIGVHGTSMQICKQMFHGCF